MTRKRLGIWIAALVIIAVGVILVYRYVEPPTGSVITQKEIQEALIRLGRATSNSPPPVFIPIEINRPVRLAIGNLGFAQNSPNENENIQDLVLAQLSGAPGLELVERQSLERVLRELNLSMSGLVRARDALRVGKLVKADWFLLGTVARVSGTNSLVLRIVDSKTGIMRDARVVSVDQPSSKIASEIAGFVGASRQSAAKPQLRSFLAIGTFQDLSVNRRQAAFPQQLRSYLMASYHDSDVTLLERDAVDILLQEVRLDLAGLADGSETNGPQPLQSAYWIVAGVYQSYETTNSQVELELEVTHAFGQYRRLFFRGKPDQSLFAEVKSAIDGQMKTNASAPWPTRSSEARLQMAAGKESSNLGWEDLIFPPYRWDMSPAEASKYQYNLAESTRAFQTVLLLEPTNREAKLYFATCLRLQNFSHIEDARSLYREVIEEPIKDNWTSTAQEALHYSFEWESPGDTAKWYRSAGEVVTNAEIARNYREEAEAAEKAAVLKQGGAKAQQIIESALFENMTNALMGNGFGHMGTSDFIALLGTNAAARRLVELYPTFKAKAPEATPYLLPAVVTAQVDTNEPLVAEFQELLDTYAGHPDATAKSESYWQHIWRPVCNWSFDHKLYRMAATLLEDDNRAAAYDPNHRFKLDDEQKKMTLAYAYLGLEDWNKALAVFQSYSNRPVEMANDGPWGDALSVVLTSEQAANCRKKLGHPTAADPREFEMGNACLCMCTPSTFIADDSGLWVGIEGQLLHLSFDLETNLSIRLPISPSTTVTTLTLNSSQIWIGTAGQGLIEFDRKSQKCRRFSVSDGLATDSITCTKFLGNRLWIGYDRSVGFIDLSTYRFTSFTPSISEQKEFDNQFWPAAPTDPGVTFIPRRPSAISGRPDEIWFVAESSRLRRYRVSTDVWDAPDDVPYPVSAIAIDGNRLFAGQSWVSDGDAKGPLGLAVMNLKDLNVKYLGEVEGFPGAALTTLELDGTNLWIGGRGYIARLDTKELKVRKYSYIPTRNVNRIQIGGGYVWAQYNWHLHRAALNDLD